MKNSIKDLVLSIAAENANESSNLFNSIMRDKIAAALETKKCELAGSMFNENLDEAVAGYEAFDFLTSIKAIDKNEEIENYFKLDSSQTEKIVEFGKKKKFKASSASGKSYARAFYDHLVKATKKYLKEEFVNEAKEEYKVVHNSYSAAIQEIEDFAKKRGFTLDDHSDSENIGSQMFDKVGSGPKKPREGVTNKFHFDLYKNNKEVNKKLHAQVYGLSRGQYELNMYIN